VTITVDIDTALRDLSADQMAHLGSVLTARAAERRRPISQAEAWEAYRAVDDIEGWTWSTEFVECGRIRKACEILIGGRGLYPEQVAAPMTVVAEFVIDFHPAVAKAAVAAGVADGMAYREGLA
jgi:hypothetical protein